MAQSQEPGTGNTYFENVSPILPVTDLHASLEYYVNVLGFKINWKVEGFAEVSRDRAGIMLCEDEQGNPGTWVWIGVSDTDLIFEEYCVKGAKIRHPPNNYPWGYELQVYDLDENVLRIGSAQKANQPIGTWLDMKGVEWTQSEGKWVRVAEIISSKF